MSSAGGGGRSIEFTIRPMKWRRVYFFHCRYERFDGECTLTTVCTARQRHGPELVSPHCFLTWLSPQESSLFMEQSSPTLGLAISFLTASGHSGTDKRQRKTVKRVKNALEAIFWNQDTNQDASQCNLCATLKLLLLAVGCRVAGDEA